MTIARVALPVALDRSFDYWAPEGLALTRGSIVRVQFARRSLIGVVVAVTNESAVVRDQLQPIDEVVLLPPLSDDVLALCEFVAGYYQQPLGMALALAVPPLGVRRALRASAETAETAPPIADTSRKGDHKAAIEAIHAVAGSLAG